MTNINRILKSLLGMVKNPQVLSHSHSLGRELRYIMFLYYVEFLELGTGTCEASASSMLREGDWDHIRDMIKFVIMLRKLDNYKQN